MSNTLTQELRETVVPRVLAAADPAKALARHWETTGLPQGAIVLVAIGKASVPMASFAMEQFGQRVCRGIAICVAESDGSGLASDGLQVVVADHPVPTARNVQAAQSLGSVLSGVAYDEHLVVLLSGGGSAQICWPREPLTLVDVQSLTSALLRSGATINQINCVRKHCEVLKGGLAAQRAGGALTSVFVLSDVLGDPIDVISSGPFAPDSTTFGEALQVIRAYGLEEKHKAVASLLGRGVAKELSETPKPGDSVFDRVTHRVIANNAEATRAACDALCELGYTVVEVRGQVQGEAGEVGRSMGLQVASLDPGQAVVWGGETTVTLGSASGRGGRNQELALGAALEIEGVESAAVLALATDGVDGPTDAAGGVVTGWSTRDMRHRGVDPAQSLATHSSYDALEACYGLIRTGATGTNVNDVMVGLRKRRD